MKAVTGNWKWAYYLKLATKLKKDFQRNQSNIKVGRFCTQNYDIIFESSVKSNTKTSKPMLQGVEIPSDALYWLWCKANWVSSLSPRVIGSVILQIQKSEAVKIYSKSKAVRKAVNILFSGNTNTLFDFTLDSKMTLSLQSTLVSYFCWFTKHNHKVFCCTYSVFLWILALFTLF